MTACFDRDGNRVEPEGVCPVYDTGSVWPTFALVKPAIDNTRVDMSPYGQSVFADASTRSRLWTSATTHDERD